MIGRSEVGAIRALPAPFSRLAAGWVKFDGSGPSLVPDTSYNVTSLTDNGVGNYTVTWERDFPRASSYALLGMARQITASGAYVGLVQNGTLAVGSTQVIIQARGPSAIDPTIVLLTAIGWSP